MPALAAWAAAWAVFWASGAWGLPPLWGFAAACALGVAASAWAQRWWRRWLIGLGFPASVAALGAAALPVWGWLLALLLLLLIYPLNAWRDAPLFPTPHSALDGLAARLNLEPDALILDAGCGLGDGLIALRRTFPQARLHGLEWSWPLRWLCALRCPWARVRQGDMWHADWSRYRVVYVFQRPESMDRAAAKAQQELRPGSWLVSLAFAAPSLRPYAQLRTAHGRDLWVYRF